MASLLMLTPQIPYPPRQGTALRNWGLLRGLAEHHEVSLLTFASADQDTKPEPTLLERVTRIGIVPQPQRSLRDRLRDFLFTGHPDLTQRLTNEAFSERLNAWLRDYAFDWIVIEGLEMAPFVVPYRGLGRIAEATRDEPVARSPRIAFDDHNCEYLLQKRAARSDWAHFQWLDPRRLVRAFYSSIQWRRLRAYEAHVCRQADQVVAVSEADAEALGAIVPDLTPLVIPNGIDVEAYATYEEAADLTQPAFVFTGTMDFRPNVDGVLWFCDQVWPEIRRVHTSAHFYIVGRNPHPRLDRLRAIPGVEITGSVPDTRPYIRGAAVYVVPLLVGGGTRLKLLESTAMGKAIVATRLAAEGFEDPGHAMVLVNTATAFADACIALARDPIAREKWGRRARVFAETYDWKALLSPLIDRLSD
ncbi:MAG: glycosyltransferase [Anaerolineae bacterium]